MARVRRMVADIDSPEGDTRRLREWLELKRLAKADAARREAERELAEIRAAVEAGSSLLKR